MKVATISELFPKLVFGCFPVKEIAKDYGITEKTASMRLARLREKLQQYLQEKELI